ncbi:MAG: hypothetical protein LBR37_04485 [Erysipelotrichaceae bacterium]|nr:hypothetical protein [Erysipelotrichaceae bacterium]
MKKFCTQTRIMWILRFMAIFFSIPTVILGIFMNPEAFLLLLMFALIYLASYIGLLARIEIYDNIIHYEVPGVSLKYLRSDLKEIIFYGEFLPFGFVDMDLCFLDSKSLERKALHINSNTKLLKELFKDFKGKIVTTNSPSDRFETKLYSLGASDEMFR